MKLSVRYLSGISSGNMVTIYGQNLWNIGRKCEGDVTIQNVKKVFKYASIPEEEKWKIEVVKDLIEVK